MIICTDCIHQDVCGLEGNFDEALVTCADKNEMPIKIGRWMNQDSGAHYPIECSECGKEPLLDEYGNYVFSDYCPSCGSIMTNGNTERSLE